MARANTYADCVNIVKVVKIDGKWASAQSSNAKAKSSGITFWSKAGMNTILKDATTWTGTMTGRTTGRPLPFRGAA